MDKTETLHYLTEHGIAYELTEHEAVYNMEELGNVDLPYPDWDAKNLFVRNDKKSEYYLITVRGTKRVQLNDFRKRHGLRRLAFASPEDLQSMLHLTPGAVTPLGLLNDETCSVRLFLDAEFEGHVIGVHPNDNTATVWIPCEDLVNLLRESGHTVDIVDIE